MGTSANVRFRYFNPGRFTKAKVGGAYATPPHSYRRSGSPSPLKQGDSPECVSGGVDIHEYRKRLERATKLLCESKISRHDKGLILKFTDVLRAERISLGRVAKYINNLKVLSQMLLRQTEGVVNFSCADKKTIVALIVSINEKNDYSPHTKRDFVIALKRFYQWLRAPSEEYPSWKRKHRYPEEVDDFSTNLKLNATTFPWDLLNEDEASKRLKSPFKLRVLVGRRHHTICGKPSGSPSKKASAYVSSTV